MSRTIEQAEKEITVLRDTMFRCVSTLSNQIPFAPSDPLAESVFDCLSLALRVANEIRDDEDRSPMNWRVMADARLNDLGDR